MSIGPSTSVRILNFQDPLAACMGTRLRQHHEETSCGRGGQKEGRGCGEPIQGPGGLPARWALAYKRPYDRTVHRYQHDRGEAQGRGARRPRASKQQVEDYESERSRLQLEHAEVIRPDARLWWGIGILITFTILGVALPLGVMVTGPRDLAQVRWVLYPFITSLVGLLGYIVLYLIQLTRTKAD